MYKNSFIFISLLLTASLIAQQKNPDQNLALIKKYAPIIYFHPDEQLYPSSVSWFVERCEVWKVTKNSKSAHASLSPSKRITKAGEIGPEEVNKLGNYSDGYYYLKPQSTLSARLSAYINKTISNSLSVGKNFRYYFNATKELNNSLFLDTSVFGEPIINNTCQAPCYAHLYKKISGEIVIQYLFFYPYNGPSKNLTDIFFFLEHQENYEDDDDEEGCIKFIEGREIGYTRIIMDKILNKVEFGAHVGDWEYIDVHLDKEKQVKEVYLSTNFPKHFGRYTNPKKLYWQGTHPIIFSALFAHTSYPKVMFLRNQQEDLTGWGAKWDTQHNIVNLDAPGQEWINFTGQWGDSVKGIFKASRQSPVTPKLQSWWRNGKKIFGHEAATKEPFSIKVTTQGKYFGQSKMKKMLSPLTTTLALLTEFKLSHAYHSDVFDLYGQIPIRSKQFLVYVTPDPKEKSPPEVTSLSIYQESFIRNNRPIFKDIKISPQGTVITHPKYKSQLKDNDFFLTYLYITDVKITGDKKENRSFIVNIHPLET